MSAIKLFESKKIRSVWDAEKEKWYFSIVDVVEILTDSPNPRKYWSVLKTRLKKEDSQLTTNCSQLKMQAADGKYMTDIELILTMLGEATTTKLHRDRDTKGFEPLKT